MKIKAGLRDFFTFNFKHQFILICDKSFQLLLNDHFFVKLKGNDEYSLSSTLSIWNLSPKDSKALRITFPFQLCHFISCWPTWYHKFQETFYWNEESWSSSGARFRYSASRDVITLTPRSYGRAKWVDYDFQKGQRNKQNRDGTRARARHSISDE